MVDFGVVRHVWPLLGAGLGALELFLALSLAVGILPQPILVTAAGLLMIFTILIVRSLRRGGRFACFCFGEGDSELSKWALGRTAALALIAATLALVNPPPDHPGLTGSDVPLAITALSALGSIVLIVQVPRLLRERDLNARRRGS